MRRVGRRSVLRDRYLAIVVAAIFAFAGITAAAHAWVHYTNGSQHGLDDGLSSPWAMTFQPGTNYSYAAVRHYYDDGSFNAQCEDSGYGNSDCQGYAWGSAPCKKRSVNGIDGVLSRHWVRRGGCPGSLHA